MTQNNKIYYFPLKIILGFLIFTEMLFWIGPIKYDINNGIVLFLYLAILNIAYYWGYKKGVKDFRPSYKRISIFALKNWVLLGFIVTCISASLWLSAKGWNFSLDTLIESFTNPGAAYYAETNEEAMHNSNYFSVLLSPIKWAVLPIGIFSWVKMSRLYKTIIIATILISLYISLASGVRKGLMDIILTSLFCIIAKHPQLISIKINYRKLKLIASLTLGAFLLYFVFSNLSRYGGSEFEDLGTMDIKGIESSYLDYFPLPIVISLSFITSYLCQGYFALAKALNYGILMPTIGGSSFFLMRISRDFFNHDPMPETYMWLLQENDGIHTTVNWHTLYLWLANDFTFILVPIIIFYVGYFFAKTWCDAVFGKNVFAYPSFCLFLIMSFYAFANNQIFSFSFLPFVFWFFLYNITKRRVK